MRRAAVGPGGAWSRARPVIAVLGPPLAWALHLGICYLAITIECTSGWSGAGWVIAAATVGLGTAAFFSGWSARGWGEPSGSENDRFLHRMGRAAAILFTLTILITGVVPMLVPAACG